MSALPVSIPRGVRTHQALSRGIITGFRVAEALTGLTDATKNSAINSSVPRPTRLKGKHGLKLVSGIFIFKAYFCL